MITKSDLQHLPKELEAIAIDSEQATYRSLQSSYMKVGNPSLILMAEDDSDVSNSIKFVNQINEQQGENIPFSVRSGGHGMSGSSTNNGGIILDVSKMNSIQVLDKKKRLVKVQAGATWGNVAQTIAPYDWVITSGNFGDVGVGGLASSGGIGYFIRSQGLTIDHIKGATLITADGTIHHVTAENNPELFWGIRGGGSQLGIITEFIFEAHEINSDKKNASIIYQSIVYSTDNMTSFTQDWGNWMRTAPLELTSFLMIQKTGATTYSIRATNVWDGTNIEDATPYLEKALALAPVANQSAAITPYPTIIPFPKSGHYGQQRIQIRNVLVDKVDATLGQAIEEAFSHQGAVAMELRFIGGKMTTIPVEDSAWAGRHQEGFVDLWLYPMNDNLQTQAFAPLNKLGTGAYGAYSSNIDPSVAELAWPRETGKRLKRLIEEVDPKGLFNQGLRL